MSAMYKPGVTDSEVIEEVHAFGNSFDRYEYDQGMIKESMQS